VANEIKTVSRKTHLVFVLRFAVAIMVVFSFSSALIITYSVNTIRTGLFFGSVVLLLLPIGILIAVLCGIIIHRFLVVANSKYEDKQVALTRIPAIGGKLKWWLEIITVLLVVITTIISRYSADVKITFSSTCAISNLRGLLGSQEQYRAQYKRYGALAELANEKLIPQSAGKGKWQDYIFKCKAAANTWSCSAVPMDQSGRYWYYWTVFHKPGRDRSYYIDQTGQMRYSDGLSTPNTSSQLLQ